MRGRGGGEWSGSGVEGDLLNRPKGEGEEGEEEESGEEKGEAHGEKERSGRESDERDCGVGDDTGRWNEDDGRRVEM